MVLLRAVFRLVEVLAVEVDACRNLPSKSATLPPVIVASVKLPELLSEMR